MNQGNDRMKFLTIIGLTALATMAAWQFYLFTTFKDANGAVDVQGGTLHLWVAIGITVLVCIGGFFFSSTAVRYDKRNEMHITSADQQSGPAGFRRDLL